MTTLDMRWRDLLFLHREVDPDTLDLPAGLEPDLFEGRAYLGHIPFRMEGVRPVGLPAVSRLSDFPETNLRTYVRLDGVPYVWFYRLETPGRSANFLARSFFGLPYVTAPLVVTRVGENREYAGGDVLGRNGSILAVPGAPTDGDALDRWLVHRDTFVVAHRGAWRAGTVRHAPYSLREVDVSLATGDGSGFAWERAIFCDGVDVMADPLRRLRSQ